MKLLLIAALLISGCASYQPDMKIEYSKSEFLRRLEQDRARLGQCSLATPCGLNTGPLLPMDFGEREMARPAPLPPPTGGGITICTSNFGVVTCSSSQ